MPVLDSYLFFNGNCAQAMRFYESALGGKLEMMMTYGELPLPPSLRRRADGVLSDSLAGGGCVSWLGPLAWQSTTAGYQAALQGNSIMIKLFAASAFIALLSACSSMMGGSMADSSGMSRTNTMGASGSMGSGGPSGASGGGPN